MRLIEPFARRVLLAHPKKLRVIAESTRKSERLDAQLLAKFLAMDMVHTSYRPTPRERDHRRLVRTRDGIQRRMTSVKNRIRRILSDYNADRKRLFTGEGLSYLQGVKLSPADRFALDRFLEEYDLGCRQLRSAERQLLAFAEEGPIHEREQRALLQTIPGVGFVTGPSNLPTTSWHGRSTPTSALTSFVRRPAPASHLRVLRVFVVNPLRSANEASFEHSRFELDGIRIGKYCQLRYAFRSHADPQHQSHRPLRPLRR